MIIWLISHLCLLRLYWLFTLFYVAMVGYARTCDTVGVYQQRRHSAGDPARTVVARAGHRPRPASPPPHATRRTIHIVSSLDHLSINRYVTRLNITSGAASKNRTGICSRHVLNAHAVRSCNWSVAVRWQMMKWLRRRDRGVLRGRGGR